MSPWMALAGRWLPHNPNVLKVGTCRECRDALVAHVDSMVDSDDCEDCQTQVAEALMYLRLAEPETESVNDVDGEDLWLTRPTETRSAQ